MTKFVCFLPAQKPDSKIILLTYLERACYNGWKDESRWVT